MSRYRYPGIQPFTFEDRHIFFGRVQDVDGLYRTIRKQPITTLYSKSGYGKSSLLNAGLLPHCAERADFDPVIIRFGAWTDQATETPLTISHQRITAEGNTLVGRLRPDDQSLWAAAKKRQLTAGKRPLLIFDQFEELFTYPAEQVIAFVRELSELVYTELPLRYRRLLEGPQAVTLSETDEDALDEPMRPAVLFAIRSDRMHLMDRLRDHLRGVLSNLFELQALDPEDARRAILQPASLPQEGPQGSYRTPPFTWAPEAVDRMLHYLATDSEQGRVEGILLQMLCREYEEQLVSEHGLQHIDPEALGDFSDIIARYYASRVSRLGAREQQARVFIEEGLILEGENIRLSLHQAQIKRQFKVDRQLLDELVDSRLLRAEPFLRGGYTYELAHDRMVPPILEAKHERLEAQKRADEERARQEAASELAAEKKKRQRARRIAGLMTALAIVALVASGLAFLQFREAKASEQEAIQRHAEAQKELCNALREKRKRLRTEIEILREDAGTFAKAGETAYQELRLSQADSLTQELIRTEKRMKPCE